MWALTNVLTTADWLIDLYADRFTGHVSSDYVEYTHFRTQSAERLILIYTLTGLHGLHGMCALTTCNFVTFARQSAECLIDLNADRFTWHVRSDYI